MGRERRPVHQRRAHHGLGTAQTPRRTLDRRHRGRRRVPHRHSTRHRARGRRPWIETLVGAFASNSLSATPASSCSQVPCCSPPCGCSFCVMCPTVCSSPLVLFPTGPTSCALSLRRQPQCWRSCWYSVSWEGGFSPAACSPP